MHLALRCILAMLLIAGAARLSAGQVQTNNFASADAPTTEVPRSDQVAAAAADATGNLRQAVLAERINREMSVGRFIDSVGGHDVLPGLLAQARQVGGPRWLGPGIVQVRLELGGDAVAQTLIDLSRRDEDRSPIPPQMLAGQLHEWSRRSFMATGNSLSAEQIASIQPESAAWQQVGPDLRRQALAEARQNAVNEAVGTVRALQTPDEKTLGDRLESADADQRIQQWLWSRPVTHVQFEDDLDVQVELAAPADELVIELRAALADGGAMDEASWESLKGQIAERLPRVVGRASVPVERPPVVLNLPVLPPRWVGDQIEAQGQAIIEDSKLKAARAAEADAAGKLRSQVMSLPLGPAETLGQVASDPRIAGAIDHGLAQARTYKVDYGGDGSVSVRVALDLRHLWRSLESIGR